MKILKKCYSKSIIHFIRIAVFLFFVAQNIYGQSDDSYIQRQVEERIAQIERVIQNINSSSRSDKAQLLEQYETMRDDHYQRLAEKGDPVAIAVWEM